MIRDDRVEEYRQKGLQESLKELEDLMAESVMADIDSAMVFMLIASFSLTIQRRQA